MELSDLVEKTLSRRRRRTDPLRIVQAGHPALRGRARDWEGQLSQDLLDELVAAMVLTMREAPGVGLAAPQVGIPLRLAVLEDDVPEGEDGERAAAERSASSDHHAAEDRDEDDVLDRRPLPLRVLLNPQYRGVGSRRAMYWEGCLSVDGWQSIVPRHLRVAWSALELRADGRIEPVQGEWTGWSARILQHETDHLSGTLCHDLAVPRSFVAAQYTERYADLAEATRRLHLTGDITRIPAGEVEFEGEASSEGEIESEPVAGGDTDQGAH